MITLRSDAETQQAEIQNALQRRADLVPNIVASTRGAMQQERAVFEDIATAQAAFQRAQQGGSTQGQLDAGAQLGAALRGYLVVVQQYPELKSLEIVRELNTVLEGTENRITVARTRYNDNVNTYNKAIQVFPGNMIANMFGFQKMPLFAATTEAQVVPKINLEFEEKQ